MRVEYLRARARAARYREQALIVQEEKRRVLESLEHDARVWDSRMAANIPADTPLMEGRAAYAAKQAAIRRRLKNKFSALWAATTEIADEITPDDGAAVPTDVPDSPTQGADDPPDVFDDEDDDFPDLGSDEESDNEE